MCAKKQLNTTQDMMLNEASALSGLRRLTLLFFLLLQSIFFILFTLGIVGKHVTRLCLKSMLDLVLMCVILSKITQKTHEIR